MGRPAVTTGNTVAIVPAFNESATVGKVVSALVPHIPVIVIDDGSQDDTGAQASQAGAIVIRSSTNSGYDGALSQGFKEADRRGFQQVVTLDADGEHDPTLISNFLDALQDVPLVLGRRPHTQRFTEKLFGLIVLRRWGVHDILCGMKGYHLTLYKQNGGWSHAQSVGTELALFGLRHGVPFREIAVRGRPRKGRPRFGSMISGNFRILIGLVGALSRPLPPLLERPWVKS